MGKKQAINKIKLIGLSLIILSFSGAANAQSGRKSTQPDAPPVQIEEKKNEKKDEPNGENRPVNIFRRPAPDASVAAYCFRKEGFDYVKTVLRVTFDATAKITAVEVKSASGCNAFDEESVDAARRIKFEPAIQNGKPITVAKTVVYQGGIR